MAGAAPLDDSSKTYSAFNQMDSNLYSGGKQSARKNTEPVSPQRLTKKNKSSQNTQLILGHHRNTVKQRNKPENQWQAGGESVIPNSIQFFMTYFGVRGDAKSSKSGGSLSQSSSSSDLAQANQEDQHDRSMRGDRYAQAMPYGSCADLRKQWIDRTQISGSVVVGSTVGKDYRLKRADSDASIPQNQTTTTTSHTCSKNLPGTSCRLQGLGSCLWRTISSFAVIVYKGMFEVWAEKCDPSKYYFPQTPSHTDQDLLNQQMRRRKILGLFLLLNILNICNLVLPESWDTPLPQVLLREGPQIPISQRGSQGKSLMSLLAMDWGLTPPSPATLINFFSATIIFMYSFYVCFCAQYPVLTDYARPKTSCLICMILQFFLAYMFVRHPCEFVFQFVVNLTVMFTLIVKEVISDKRLMAAMLLNNFFVIYVAMHSVKLTGAGAEEEGSSTNDGLMGSEKYIRAYIFGLAGVVLQVFQIQSLNRSLIRMLVGKVNSLQRTLEIKDVYNASMIHELRNPLNAVLGSIGLLKYSKSLSKEDMETLNIASVCGEILITFINNALDGAKLEANKLELDYHMSDIVEVLSKAVSLYTWKSKEKKISIGLKIAKCMPEQVEIDEARLAQVLVNLIGNAVKFTPAHGNVKVRSRFLPDFGHVINSSQSGGSSSEACSEEQEALRKHFAQLTGSQYFKDSSKQKQEHDGTILEESDRTEEDEKDQKAFEERYFFTKQLGLEIQVSDMQTNAGDFSPVMTNNAAPRHDEAQEAPQLQRQHSNNLYIMEATGGPSQNMDSHSNIDISNKDNYTQTPGDDQDQNNNEEGQSQDSDLSLYNNADQSSTEGIERPPQLQVSKFFDDIVLKNSFQVWPPQTAKTVREVPFHQTICTQENQIEESKTESPDNKLLTQRLSELYPAYSPDNHPKTTRLDSGQLDHILSDFQSMPQPPLARNSHNQLQFDLMPMELAPHSAATESTPWSKQSNQSEPDPNFLLTPVNPGGVSSKKRLKSTFFKAHPNSAAAAESGEFTQMAQRMRESELMMHEGGQEEDHHQDRTIVGGGEEEKRERELEEMRFQFINKKNLSKRSVNLSTYKKVKTNVKGTLVIEVIDTGIGISHEGLQKLFKPFSQADKSIQTRYGGTGLGLWISQKLVSLMRGKISVFSELNKGTVFVIQIPVNSEVQQIVMDSQTVVQPDSANSNNLTAGEDTPQSSQVGDRIMMPKPGFGRGGHVSEGEFSNHQQQQLDSGLEQIKILLYQNDEMMKNLIKKYLQKHKIAFSVASNFKNLIRLLITKEFKALFIDIDVNVKAEDLERLVCTNEQLRSDEPPFKCRIYCFYSREIDRTKTRFLQRNHIHCVKKPVQGYQLSKYIRRVKYSDGEDALNVTKKDNQLMPVQYQVQPRIKGETSDSLRDAMTEVRAPLRAQMTVPVDLSQFAMPPLSLKPSIDDQEDMRGCAQSDPNSPIYMDNGVFGYNHLVRNPQKEYQESTFKVANKQTMPTTVAAPQQSEKDPPGSLSSSRIQDELMVRLQNFKLPNKQLESLKRKGYPYSVGNESRKQSSYNVSTNNELVQSVGSVDSSLIHHALPGPTSQEEDPDFSATQQQQQIQHHLSQNTLLGELAPRERRLVGSEEDNEEEEEKGTQQFLQGIRRARAGRRGHGDLLHHENTPRFNQSQQALSQNNNSNNSMGTGSSQNPNKRSDNDQEIKQSDNSLSSDVSGFELRVGGGATTSRGQQLLLKHASNRLQSLSSPQLDKSIPNSKQRQSGNTPNLSHSEEEKRRDGVIMLVDDNGMNTLILQKMLEMIPESTCSFKVVTASNGQEAFELFTQINSKTRLMSDRVRLIFMDCEMPIMDGYESTRLIREAEGQNGWPPATIVGLTGNSGNQYLRLCKNAGMDDLRTKPLPLENLITLVNKVFKQQK